MVIGRSEDRDNPWDRLVLRHHCSVWNPIRVTHLGQRSTDRTAKAGHMTATDQTVAAAQPLQAGGRPHMPVYVQATPARVRKRGETLVIQTENDQETTARLIDTSHLVLVGAVDVTGPCLHELMRREIPRIVRALPARGRIGIFNRSHYEEMLAVRVHPALLAKQRLPASLIGKRIWAERFEAIAAFERHLARQGWVIQKFFLHI